MSDNDLLDQFLSVASEEIKKSNTTAFEDALSSIENTSLNRKDKVKKPSKSKTSLIHAGDTDSSDDEDNRNFENNKYNEFGKDVKHLLNQDQLQVTSSALQQTSSNAKSAWTTNKQVQANQVKFQPLFGIRVINPLVSTKLLEERLVGREVVPMVKLKMFVLKVTDNVDWVVTGVVVSKSATKTSQNGKNYCAWTLSDLKNDLRTVTVLLFSSAHKELWKTAIGTVVGILNPTVMDLREGSKDEACLSVYNHQRVMIIGQSKDLGTCKSMKKNGERCTSFVNVSNCEFCIYHVKQEYQKVAKRSELQSGFSGGGLTALRNKVLGKDQVFYAGKLYTAIPAKKNGKQVAKDANRMQALSGKISLKQNVKVKTAQKHAANLELSAAQRQKDLERLKQLGAPFKLDEPGKFDGEISKDVTIEGSKNLALNVISKLKNKSNASSEVNGLAIGKEKEVVNQNIDLSLNFKSAESVIEGNKSKIVGPSNVSTDVRNNTKAVESTQLSKVTSNLPFLNVAALSKNSEIDLNAPVRKSHVTRAKKNALFWVQSNGPIQKVDPNNTRGTDKGKKRAIEVLNLNSSETKKSKTEENDPLKKKIQENEFFSERFKKMMAATSSHTDLLEQRDDEEQEKYFNKLEMKERMEEKMCSTYKVACKAVRCLKCKYTSFSASDMCKQEKHPLKVFDAIKRFYKCGDCKNRTVCLTFIPTDPCKNCGSGKWEKTSMMKEKIVDIGAPKLSIRGGEQKFVNSNATNANLDLLVPDD